MTDARLAALGRALNASSACITHGDVYIAKDCPGCEGRLQSILDAMHGWTMVPDDALGEDNLTIHLLEAKIEQLRSALDTHGVGMVDKIGVSCLCDAAFSFDLGGWVAFNAHLRAAPGQR